MSMAWVTSVLTRVPNGATTASVASMIGISIASSVVLTVASGYVPRIVEPVGSRRWPAMSCRGKSCRRGPWSGEPNSVGDQVSRDQVVGIDDEFVVGRSDNLHALCHDLSSFGPYSSSDA